MSLAGRRRFQCSQERLHRYDVQYVWPFGALRLVGCAAASRSLLEFREWAAAFGRQRRGKPLAGVGRWTVNEAFVKIVGFIKFAGAANRLKDSDFRGHYAATFSGLTRLSRRCASSGYQLRKIVQKNMRKTT